MKRMAVLAAIFALVAVSCSGGTTQGKARSGGVSGAPVNLPGTVKDKGTRDLSSEGKTITLTMEADDFYFDPTYIKATPGAMVKVQVKNEGAAGHSFTIDALKVDEVIQPGEQKDVTFTLPVFGNVNFYCRFHRTQGMQGAFYF
jgi:plastocyanin